MTDVLTTHIPTLKGCSSFLYQIEVMVMKAGETAPSAKPRKHLTVTKPAKLCGAARHMQIMPQTTIVMPTNLAIGSLLMK